MIINSTVTDGETAAYTVRISWTKGWLISQAGWRRMEWDGVRFHHATQNGMQFKIYELFISGNFHLIFSDHNWPRVNGVTDGRGGVTVIWISYCLFYTEGRASFTDAGERTSTPTTTPLQSTASWVCTGPLTPPVLHMYSSPAHCTYLKVISGEEKQHGQSMSVLTVEIHVCWEYKGVHPLWQLVQRFFKRLKTGYHTTHLQHSEVYIKRRLSQHICTCLLVHYYLHNNQDRKLTSKRSMVKYDTHTLFSHNKCNCVICKKLDGTGEHHVKQNQPDSEWLI